MLPLSELLNSVLMIDDTARVIEFERRWFTWGQLRDMIADIRREISAVGGGADTRVGVLMRNRPGPLAATLAALIGHHCLVTLNPLYPDDKLAQDIETLRLPIVIGEAADLNRDAVVKALTASGSAAIELAPNLEGARLRHGVGADARSLHQVCSPGVIIEMLTSGTTGVPKRIALQRQAFEKSFAGALGYEQSRKAGDPPKLRTGMTNILANPISHIGGLWGALSCVAAGRQACLLERFIVEDWRDAVVRHRPKVAAAVPASLRMILDAQIPKEDLSSLVALRTGTAPLDPEVIAEFWSRYQIPVLQNYGATEFSGAVAGWTLKDFHTFHDRKVGSVGKFQAGVKGRVVDPDTGAVLAAGEPGILEMKASQFGIGDQWLRTTDRAIVDDDGFLFILGRSDNAIIRGGYKVHPDDVVLALEKHPAIREAVVVGLPDRRLGEVPVAALMLKTGAERPTPEALKLFLKERLLPYQVPTDFLYVDDVPRTPSMKPALPQVRELFAAAVQGQV